MLCYNIRPITTPSLLYMLSLILKPIISYARIKMSEEFASELSIRCSDAIQSARGEILCIR